MSDPTILFVKPKAITQRDKKALQGAGVLVIEIDNPANAKLIRAGTELSGSAMLLAAAEAISKSNVAREAFGTAMAAAIMATGTGSAT